MSRGRRLLLKLARLVHVYLTMFGFVMVLFFAVTGFMLNHEDWFLPAAEDEERYTTTTTGVLPTALLHQPDKLAIVELLRKDFGAAGAMNDFDDKDEKELRVAFKGPGREDVAVIQRDSGQTEVTHKVRGLLAILTDLHKGKDAGAVWKLLIDGVCVLLLFVSMTGFILWQSLRGRAHYGLVFMGLGLMVGVGVFFLLVP